MALSRRMAFSSNKNGLSRGSIYGAALCAAAFLSTPAFADFYIHAWEDHHEAPGVFNLGATLNYYTTSTNFTATSTTSTPSGLQNIIKFEPDVDAIYGISARLSAFARVSWESLTVQGPPRAGSSYGFFDQTIGLNYRLLAMSSLPGIKKPSLDLQIQADIPAYSSVDTGTGPNLGDSTTDLTGGLFGRYPLISNPDSTLWIVGGGGFTYRSASFSSAIPYSVFVEYKPTGEGLTASLGGFGIYSLNNDAYTLTTGTATRATTSTDGSYLVNAIDPTLVNVRGTVGYNIDRDFNVFVQAIFAVAGTSAPDGTTFAGGVRMRFGGERKAEPAHIKPTALTPDQYGKSNRGFVNYGVSAKVMRTNDRLNLIKIDKGSQDGIEVGQIFDIFSVKADGSTGEAIARTQVNAVKPSEAALSITEYFQEVLIDEGFVAKRLLQ
jgi:hypothetical protein